MAIRIPRGYARNRPYFLELCEGIRPNSQAAPRVAYTGLPMVREDKFHDAPIVIDAGTIIGVVTGGATVGAGTFVPAVMGTGAVDVGNLTGIGATNDWGLPTTNYTLAVGRVKPLGVCFAPVYSFILPYICTNFKMQSSTPFLTDYVIQIPATNADEVVIEAGDVVVLGPGKNYGSGVTSTYSTNKLAGRYAKLSTSVTDYPERIVGRCLRRLKLGNISGASGGEVLADNLASFTIDAGASAEFSDLAMTQTVPGLGLTGSGTAGIPGHLLGATADTSGNVWMLTILIRL